MVDPLLPPDWIQKPSVDGRRALKVGLRGGRRRSYTPTEKLQARIIEDAKTRCWIVSGHANRKGYVHIHLGTDEHGKMIRTTAHRLAWQLWRGEIPKGSEVGHRCDRPRCCNPDHLFLCTRRENHLDAVRKGRKNAFGRQRLNEQQVRAIRRMAALGRLQKDIARQFGITRQSVSAIVNRQSWTHLDEPNPKALGTKSECPSPFDDAGVR